MKATISHVRVLRRRNPLARRHITLVDFEAALAIAHLRTSPSQAVRDIADLIEQQCEQPTDDCRPRGLRRF